MQRDLSSVIARLATAPLTYPEVGATRDDAMPAGYGHVRREAGLGAGREVFERAAAGLMSWRMHEAAGFPVTSSAATAAQGVVVIQRPGVGPLRLTVPCRVIYTVAEAGRQGFAYGTLDGHPERGEESFMIEVSDTNDVRIIIRSFSRPASLLARAGGPMTRLAQQYATGRYLKAIRGIAG